jgi:hypothetical protein
MKEERRLNLMLVWRRPNELRLVQKRKPKRHNLKLECFRIVIRMVRLRRGLL